MGEIGINDVIEANAYGAGLLASHEVDISARRVEAQVADLGEFIDDWVLTRTGRSIGTVASFDLASALVDRLFPRHYVIGPYIN